MTSWTFFAVIFVNLPPRRSVTDIHGLIQTQTDCPVHDGHFCDAVLDCPCPRLRDESLITHGTLDSAIIEVSVENVTVNHGGHRYRNGHNVIMSSSCGLSAVYFRSYRRFRYERSAPSCRRRNLSSWLTASQRTVF